MENVKGFRSPRPQLAMIGTIASTFAESRRHDDEDRRGINIVVVEAGTVLDKRLAKTTWGRMLWKGLPPFALKIGVQPHQLSFKTRT